MPRPMFGSLEVEIGPFNPASTKSQATRDKSLAQSLAKSNNCTQLFRLSK